MGKTIAIIPARGGSKRIPRKNIKPFLGKPIIQYSIEAALDCPVIDKVIVSTDDLEIAEVAKKAGAIVPFMRTSDNSNDSAMLFDVVKEVLGELEKLDEHYDKFCLILATAPFVTSKILEESYHSFSKGHADAVIPVVKFSFPIQRAFKINTEKRLEMIWPENMHKHSQELEESYHDVGQFYWLDTASFLREEKIFLQKTAPYVLEEKYCQDIDTYEDWEIAEMKYKIIFNLES